MVLEIASLYCGLLAFGCLAPLPLVKLQEIGQGFYRFFGFMCVALETLALGIVLWTKNGSFNPVFLTASGLFLFSTLCFTVLLRVRVPRVLWSLFAVSVLSGFFATCVLSGRIGATESWPLVLHAFSSALVMGFAILAMMLGHWYLVTPKLSITPLKRFAGGYILLCLWKTCELVVFYYIYVGMDWTKPATEMGSALAHREVIFALFRVTWGVLAPLGFSYWIWETVKMKSTQSATGILYAAMVCTMIGEGIGLYLTLSTGVPF